MAAVRSSVRSSAAAGGNLDIWSYLILIVVGVVAGFTNVMAGGGSLLTMPVMIFMGMSPATANGTNRIALLAQNITSVTEFRRKGLADFRLSLTLGLCTLPGAVLGAGAALAVGNSLGGWIGTRVQITNGEVVVRVVFAVAVVAMAIRLLVG